MNPLPDYFLNDSSFNLQVVPVTLIQQAQEELKNQIPKKKKEVLMRNEILNDLEKSLSAPFVANTP